MPTIAETYPGFESESWVAVFAPAATSSAVLEKLHKELSRITSDPEIRSRFESQGCDVVGGSREALAEMVRKDQAKWSRLIREKQITIQ